MRDRSARHFGQKRQVSKIRAYRFVYAITEAPTVLLKNEIRKSHFRHALAGTFLLFLQASLPEIGDLVPFGAFPAKNLALRASKSFIRSLCQSKRCLFGADSLLGHRTCFRTGSIV